MENVLVIYDTTGYILQQMQGSVREPVGIPFLWVEVPFNKRLIGINVENEVHKPIFEELPKSEVTALKEQVEALNIALAEIIGG